MMYVRKSRFAILGTILAKGWLILLAVALLLGSCAYQHNESELKKLEVIEVLNGMKNGTVTKYEQVPAEWNVHKDYFIPGRSPLLYGKNGGYHFWTNNGADELRWEFSGYPEGQLWQQPNVWLFCTGWTLLFTGVLIYGLKAVGVLERQGW